MKSILVVEDMPIFREPIEAVLRAEGFETVGASNGQEALLALTKSIPNLIILDLAMPLLDGIAVLRAVRTQKNLQHIPVLVLSSETDRARVMQAVKLGVVGYMLKSNFSLKELLQKIRAALAADSGIPSTSASSKLAVPDISPMAPASSLPPVASRVCGAATKIAAAPERSRSASLGPAPALHGSIPTDLKSLKPLVTRSDLLERIKACEELKGFSPTVTQVLNLSASETCSLDTISKAVRQDQAMALKILKVANSSAYSRGDRVDTVHKAISRIGLQSIRQVVLTIAVVDNFSSKAFSKYISTQHFWEHSIACGLIAADIAHATKAKDADSAFTSGLLHDLGRVILAEALGDLYVQTLETARALQAPLEQVESRLLLLNHADLMDRLLGAWHLPKDLVDPIMFHHLSAGNVRSVAPTRAAEVIRLGLADRLAHAMLMGSSGNETIYPTQDHCRALNVGAATIADIRKTAREQTDETKFALLSNASGAPWVCRVDQLRKQLGAPLRHLFVGTSPEIDAFSIFCDELADKASHEPPAIAIVHLSQAKEKSVLPEMLEASEKAAGASNLPTIVLSPPGSQPLTSPVMAARSVIYLPTPLSVAAFIRAANSLLQPADQRKAA